MIFNMGAGGASTAEAVQYDNKKSGLESDNVQGALDEVNQSLTANNAQAFQFAYNSESGKYGYKIKEADTDVFVPFSSKEPLKVITQTTFNTSDNYTYVTTTLYYNNVAIGSSQYKHAYKASASATINVLDY